jgi:hypothetical protein
LTNLLYPKNIVQSYTTIEMFANFPVCMNLRLNNKKSKHRDLSRTRKLKFKSKNIFGLTESIHERKCTTDFLGLHITNTWRVRSLESCKNKCNKCHIPSGPNLFKNERNTDSKLWTQITGATNTRRDPGSICYSLSPSMLTNRLAHLSYSVNRTLN